MPPTIRASVCAAMVGKNDGSPKDYRRDLIDFGNARAASGEHESHDQSFFSFPKPAERAFQCGHGPGEERVSH